MVAPGAGTEGDRRRDLVAPLFALASAGACGAVVVASRADRINSLSVILGIASVVAGVFVTGEGDGLGVSAGFVVGVLAAAFLGPRSAMLSAVTVELTATAVLRTHWRLVVYNNLPASVLAAFSAALVVRGIAPRPTDTAPFFFAVVLAAVVSNAVSYAAFAVLRRLVAHQASAQFGLDTFLQFLPSAGLASLLAVAGSAITVELGLGAIAFALAGVFAFAYMSHLLHVSRERAESYASLSWGVLGGLMRALDLRDGRTARHSAAVAKFARDMAAAVDMDEAEQELAHTAGLLHDIGRFALSDRVAERGRTLTEEDWVAIQRHPELGADMLRDLGIYGPVAEIVLAHHERIDGRGYPHGVLGEAIPELAKIIAVAEVYDTLTASDTYRTRMSSFEALNELRRVGGSQLDAHYVEVLARLLGGEGVEYRHADAADFDIELGMERRIREAGASG